MRSNQRAHNALRKINFTRHYTKYAEGSVLTEFGDTIVLCNASVTEGVPKFLKETKQGWLTAEYAMLPRATHTRSDREAAKGKQGGRTIEIQRLIGRALRICVDLQKLETRPTGFDGDVIKADGGTRTAAISGACVALYDALKKINALPAFKQFVAAISVGIYNGAAILDLDYTEDSQAESDMNRS